MRDPIGPTGPFFVAVLAAGALMTLCLAFSGCGQPPNPELAQAKADAAKAHQSALYAMENQQKALAQLNKAVAFLEKAHEAPTEAATKALLTRANEAAVQAGLGSLLPTEEGQPPAAEQAAPVATVKPIGTQHPEVQEEPLEILYEPAPTPALQRISKPPVPKPQRTTKALVAKVAKAPSGGKPTCTEKTIPCTEAWLAYWAPNNGVKVVNTTTLLAIRLNESGTGPNIWGRGADGEYGAMQVMPKTGEGMGVPLPRLNTVEGNTLAGTRVFAKCVKANDSDRAAALACYNGGQGAASKGHHLVAGSQVNNYVRRVLKLRSQLA